MIFLTLSLIYITKLPYNLQQFERDKKTKIDSGGFSGGSGEGDLDEFLSDLTPSEFYDDNLMRLTGLPWADFIELIEMDNQGWMPSRSVSIISQGKTRFTHNFIVHACFYIFVHIVP